MKLRKSLLSIDCCELVETMNFFSFCWILDEFCWKAWKISVKISTTFTVGDDEENDYELLEGGVVFITDKAIDGDSF